MADEQTHVTLIQDENGATKRIRIGDTEFPVLTSAPQPGTGQMNLFLTIPNTTFGFERLPKPGETPAAKDG